jgi:hypothetical protein
MKHHGNRLACFGHTAGHSTLANVAGNFGSAGAQANIPFTCLAVRLYAVLHLRKPKHLRICMLLEACCAFIRSWLHALCHFVVSTTARVRG